MLFNSAQFVYLFLPLAFAGFFMIARWSARLAAGWLTAASIVFYGWWNPIYVPLLLGSVLGNYLVARALIAAPVRSRGWIVTAAVAVDLVLLGYFKYANFFVQNVAELTGQPLAIGRIVLPLGISFFTFTQIAFLVDTYRGLVREPRLLHYTLFVTYFPHLIAGPILHHSEMMPQFARAETYRPSAQNVAVGLTIFCIGLFKKVILADNVADFANPGFNAAAAGHALTLLDAWGAVLAYTLQLYFDFSGYSDMAIGISRLFGITLPLNFASPYQSASIIEFWRRWHMTLSRFLREYLYIGLGGNRRGPMRRYVNLLTTMVLGGLWHGAAWTYVLWGTLHGCFLMINHGWRALRGAIGWNVRGSRLTHAASVALTLFLVAIAWVFFRADNVGTAVNILHGMAGGHGIVLPAGWETHLPDWLARMSAHAGVTYGNTLFEGLSQCAWIVALLGVALFCPNTQEVMRLYQPALEARAAASAAAPIMTWRLSAGWALAIAVLAIVSLASLDRVTQFIYFQF